MSITIPFIFFGVAAFLLNVVLGRLVTAQREQDRRPESAGLSDHPAGVPLSQASRGRRILSCP